MIKTAHVISDTSKDDEVGINNTVQVYIEEDDETETYKLVTTVRGNSLKGYVRSAFLPIPNPGDSQPSHRISMKLYWLVSAMVPSKSPAIQKISRK